MLMSGRFGRRLPKVTRAMFGKNAGEAVLPEHG